eukprot:136667-Heterocapsa_arctica.AAC.1
MNQEVATSGLRAGADIFVPGAPLPAWTGDYGRGEANWEAAACDKVAAEWLAAFAVEAVEAARRKVDGETTEQKKQDEVQKQGFAEGFERGVVHAR